MRAIYKFITFKLELRRVSALVYAIFREFLTVFITYQKETRKYWFSDPEDGIENRWNASKL